MESPGTAKTLSSYRYIFVVQELPNFPIDITQSMFAGCQTHKQNAEIMESPLSIDQIYIFNNVP